MSLRATPQNKVLSSLLEFFRKRKLQEAFKLYIHELGPALSNRYGLREQFTVMQVQATVEYLGLEDRFIAYAVALYRYEESDNTINLLGVDQLFLDQLRLEIAKSIFDGNERYNASDVLGLSKKTTWRGGAPPNWMANRNGQTSL